MVFPEQLFFVIVIFVTAGVLIALSNMLWVRRFEDYDLTDEKPPFVSILVPARDEEHNIEGCVRSLLAQDYLNFEVVVLDDFSTDATGMILRRIARGDSRLRILEGKSLPPDWPGKHWACQQLADAAHGELLLFTDADTRHNPTALSHSVAAMQQEGIDLLTALPRQEVVTWSEKLIVPFMAWAIHSYLPLRLAQKLQLPAFSLTIGQYMLFRREAFEAVGGFQVAIGNVNDDVALGRAIITAGYEWRLLNASGCVTCRMYRGFSEVLEGFSKNVFGFFDYRILPYMLTWLAVVLCFLEPLLAIIARQMGTDISTRLFNFSVIAVIEALLLFVIGYRTLRIPLYLILVYPLTIFFFVLVAIRSMVITLTGHASWKGRELKKSDVKWL
jgi:chlorobactene glucosyltransferase